jgi:hypothetical protein
MNRHHAFGQCSQANGEIKPSVNKIHESVRQLDVDRQFGKELCQLRNERRVLVGRPAKLP